MSSVVHRRLVVVAIIVVSVSAASVTETIAAFSDVNVGSSYGQAAEYLRDLGIVQGYGDGSFRPGNNINRAEFIKIVASAAMKPADISGCTWNNPFTDVPRGVWYERYVCAAYRSGVIRGYDDGTFRGGSPVNMAEAAKIIVEAYGITYQADAELWYRGYIQALGKAEAFPPTVQSPSQELRRAEMAYVIAQVLRAGYTSPTGTVSQSQGSPSGLPVHDIVYSSPSGSDAEMTSLDVYAPKDAANLPVVVWVHGGGWTEGDKSGIEEHPHFAEFFRRQGYILVSINYRLMRDDRSPETTYKEQAQDVAAAVAWTRRNIAAYGGSPDDVFLLGHSAGAHLVSLVGVDEQYLQAVGESLTSLQGVVALDVVAYDIPRAIATAAELGYAPSARNLPTFFPGEAAQIDASPVLHIQSGAAYPPFLIVYAEYKNGANGAQVSQQLGADQSDRFAAALRDAGAQAQSFYGKGQTHAALIMELGEADHAVTDAIVTFLACNTGKERPATDARLPGGCF